jgi:NAD(P)-dependent dehydrogenase (short-subunit alcohol dehydrogenase family)
VTRPGCLEGRTCLIVGGTSGMGLASARRFLGEGARVVVSGHDPELGHHALDQLAPLGPIQVETADVRDPAAVEALFRSALDGLGGRLDILFHVAGISGRRFGDGPLHECSVEGFDRVLATNARGVFLTNRAAVQIMRAQEIDAQGVRGTILNMGSAIDEAPSPFYFGTIAYAVSKAAVRALTLAAAARYAPERIRINLIAPAVTDTPMAARAVGDPVIRAYLSTKMPLASGPIPPDDVAEAALFLCAPAARFITGTVLTVDAGWRITEGQRPDDSPR